MLTPHHYPARSGGGSGGGGGGGASYGVDDGASCGVDAGEVSQVSKPGTDSFGSVSSRWRTGDSLIAISG